MGRYISLEKLIEDTKESYYDALAKSSAGWHSGDHSLLPWTEYLLGVILASYRQFEQRVGSLSSAKGAKSQMVLDTLRAFSGDFSSSEIRERCPGVSLDLIRSILKEQKKLGAVESLGRGADGPVAEGDDRIDRVPIN